MKFKLDNSWIVMRKVLNVCLFNNQAPLFFFWKHIYLGSTPCKAEQSLQGMELQEKEVKRD